MPSIDHAAPRRAARHSRPVNGWLLAAFGALVFAAVLGGASGPPLETRGDFAAPEAQRVEDWRGNSADLTPAP